MVFILLASLLTGPGPLAGQMQARNEPQHARDPWFPLSFLDLSFCHSVDTVGSVGSVVKCSGGLMFIFKKA